MTNTDQLIADVRLLISGAKLLHEYGDSKPYGAALFRILYRLRPYLSSEQDDALTKALGSDVGILNPVQH